MTKQTGGSARRQCQAQFRRRSTHVPNLTDELSTAKERCLNPFGTAGLGWCSLSNCTNRCDVSLLNNDRVHVPVVLHEVMVTAMLWSATNS